MGVRNTINHNKANGIARSKRGTVYDVEGAFTMREKELLKKLS